MPETKVWSARVVGWLGLGLVCLACSSTTTGTGPAGDDDGDDDDAGSVPGSDAGTDASATPDSGDDDAGDDASAGDDGADGGDGSVRPMDAGICDPVDPPDTFSYHAPLQMKGACTGTQVTDYVNACGTGATSATCAPFRVANTGCIACIESETTDGPWGAVVIDSILGEETANTAGCVVALDNDSDTKACAAQSEDITLCVAAACDQSCDESSYDDGQSCEGTALQVGCVKYVNAANDCVQNIPTSYTDTCKVGSNYNYNQTVTAVATVLCVGQ